MSAPPAKRGFMSQIRSFPAQFWVANTMEIFERLSWYGWFTVMALYVTAPPENGGLGFSTEVRGNLQGIVPFFLYLFPVITGALADRFGFKRMFIIAYIVMILSYYLLGQFTTLPTFFLAFMFVAVGAAIFKPVVVGTVARVTDESNSATGFGIFYMMVNVGGFLGPIVAGIVRGWDWDWVFIACSFWALMNLIIVLLFYREPAPVDGVVQKKEGTIGAALGQVFRNAAEVLGNFRFVLTCGVALVALMIAGLGYEWFTLVHCAIFVPAWIFANMVFDLLMPPGSGKKAVQGEARRPWFAQRMYCSNWRFALFLLIMSGFWTAFNQIFITMPEYIRDFTETKPLIRTFESVFGEGIAEKVATINDDERETIVRTVHGMASAHEDGRLDDAMLSELSYRLERAGVVIPPERLRAVLNEEGPTEPLDDRVLEAASVTTPPREMVNWTAIVAAVRALDEALDTKEVLPDDEIKALTNEGARELWSLGVRLSGPKMRGIVGETDEATAAASDAVLQYRKSLINEAAHLHDLERLDWTVAKYGVHELLASKVRVTPEELKTLLAEHDGDIEQITDEAITMGRQFNPEFIVNINALSIVLFQVLVSFVMGRFHRFTTMIVGMVVAGVGIGLSAVAGGEGFFGAGAVVWIVALGLLTFSFGEMMASPTSQEYVGRIAPGDKKALYMGYYFVAIALGNLFGGILSGQLYGNLARDMQRPDLMWLVFGALMFVTALIFVLYNKFALPSSASDSLTEEK